MTAEQERLFGLPVYRYAPPPPPLVEAVSYVEGGDTVHVVTTLEDVTGRP